MEFKDYYDTLGVTRQANRDEIKRAYRKLARKYHPDVSHEPNAEERFKEVNEAYEVLHDPEKRAAYDKLGQSWKAGQEFEPPPDWDTNFEFSGGGFTRSDASHFSDFFEKMFGRAHSGFNFSRENSHYSSPLADNLHARIFIDLEDSLHGKSKIIALEIPYLNSNGRVLKKTRQIELKVPKGICQGQQIRLKGQNSSDSETPGGDIYLEVNFNRHPRYRINGKDLEFDLPITPWEAALGESIEVFTPSGPVKLKIPANAKTDQKLRLKSRGIPGQSADKNGHLTAILKIVLPPASNEDAKALYKKMEAVMPFNPRKHSGDAR